MFRKVLIGLVFLAFLAGGGAIGAFLWGKSQYEKPGPHTEDQVVLIKPGSSVVRIAKQLQVAGILEDDLIFRLGVRYEGTAAKLRAGEFLIPAAASMKEAAEVLVSGKVIEHRLTIPEGLTTREVLALVNGDNRLSGIMVADVPEGSLLPETYQFIRGTERQKLVTRMQSDQSRLLTKAWQGRVADLPLETLEEALVLASIVEKETGVAGERRKVASVFINRLKMGMPLQSDPTVIFALTEGKKPLGRALTRKDWRFEHSYNTYVNSGLPPGPIANPGSAAIEAVLNPEETDYLFFVADGTGGHAFAKTLRDHNRNVAQWRKFKKKNAQ